MKNSTFIKRTFQSIFLTIITISLFNYVIDPFYQFRINFIHKVCFLDSRNSNAGLIKNYKYDSIILGTSMSENFRIQQIQSLLGYKSILKLPIEAGAIREETFLFNSVQKYNKNIKQVFWGLDTFSFFNKKQNLDDIPIFLYKDSILSNVQYLLSTDTLIHSFKLLWNQHPHPAWKYDPQQMYEWQKKCNNQFLIKNILYDWKHREEHFNNYSNNDLKYNALKYNFDTYVLPILKINKNINFTLLFLPYSILYFKTLEEKNVLEDTLALKKYIYEATKSLPNVKLYDFQIAQDVTHNLNNYKDLGHYHQKINDWMIKQISKNNYLLLEKNADIYINQLREQTKNYKINFQEVVNNE